MTKEELNNKLYEAASIGEYIDFRDDVFRVEEENNYNIKRTFSHIDPLFEYLEQRNKLIKNIKCIDGIIRGGGRDTTCNFFVITVIDGNYTFDELVELGYTFKQANAILKKQEAEII